MNDSIPFSLRRLAAVLLVVTSGPLFANEMGHDVRELCRIEVSGRFLQLRSDIEMLDGSLGKNKAMHKELSATLKQRSKDMEKYSGVGPGESSELDEKMIAWRFELDTLTSQVKDYAAHITAMEKEREENKQTLAAFEKGLQGLFEYAKVRDLPEGSYPIKLQYRHGCHEYQILCPLPKDQAERLRKLSALLKDPVSCQRYANLSNDPG